MTIDKINRAAFATTSVVHSYINFVLQPPEVSIFIKYHDNFVNKHVLDIGCGTGRTTFYLRNFTNHYIGIDYAAPMVDYCKRKYTGMKFRQCDARNMGMFSDESFDFVLFSYNGIDYINNHDRILALYEIYRVLKHDGLFVFSSHNRDYKHMLSGPMLKFTINPIKQLHIFSQYIASAWNHKINSNRQNFTDEYAIVNDSGNNYRLLTYYIDRTHQIDQLSNIGFTALEEYDMEGKIISSDENTINSCWIYYVAIKP